MDMLIILFVLVLVLVRSGCTIDWEPQSREASSLACFMSNFCTREGLLAAISTDQKFKDISVATVDNILGSDDYNRMKWKSCSCSPSCIYYNTCCRDITYKLPSVAQSVKRDQFTCVTVGRGVTPTINTCPKSYNIRSVKQMCESENPVRVYMTDHNTYLTYSNLYCALCNGVRLDDLTPWSTEITCTNDLVNSLETKPTVAQLIEFGFCNLKQLPPTTLESPVLDIYGVSLHRDMASPCSNYPQPISKCKERDSQSVLEKCENGPMGMVVSKRNNQVFKNLACALCNGIPAELIQCQRCETGKPCPTGETRPPAGLSGSFRVLVQPYSQGQTSCSDQDGRSDCQNLLSELPRCQADQYLNLMEERCVSICPNSTVLFNGDCRRVSTGETPLTCDQMVTYNKLENLALSMNWTTMGQQMDSFYLQSEGTNGSTIAYCHKCTRLVSSLDLYRDDSYSYVTKNGHKINPVFVGETPDASQRLVCVPESAILYPTMSPMLRTEEIITIALCLMSIVCLIIFFLFFSIWKRMRNIPGCIVASKLFMFLCAYVLFLSREILNYYWSSTACYTLSVLINYCFISAFVFVILYSLMIIRSLDFVELDSRCRSTTVAKYLVTGCLLPLLFIVPAILVDQLAPNSRYAPLYGGDSAETTDCFMRNPIGIKLYFILPIGLCLLIAVIVYIIVVQRLRQIAAATYQVRSSHKEKVYLSFKLIIILGFNWIFAVIAAFISPVQYPTASKILTFIFIVLCCLHGVFGFLVFIASGSNYQRLKDKIKESKGTSSAVANYGQPPSTNSSELLSMIKYGSRRGTGSLGSTPQGSPVATRYQGSPNITPAATPNRSPSPRRAIVPAQDNVSVNSQSKPKCDFF